MRLSTIPLLSLCLFSTLGVGEAAECPMPAIGDQSNLPLVMQGNFGRTQLLWSQDDYERAFTPLLRAIIQEAPTPTSKVASYQTLVIDAKRKEKYITYGKWTGIVLVSGAIVIVTWGTGAPVTSAIGTAIGGNMGLSGAAATSAGLAWLGGGAILAGGGGMATGTTVIALSGMVVDYIAGKAIESGAGYLLLQTDFSDAIRLTSETKQRHSFERSLEALQAIRRAQLLGGDGRNVHLARLNAGILLLQIYEDLSEASPYRAIIAEQTEAIFTLMSKQLPNSSLPDLYLGRLAFMASFQNKGLDPKKVELAKKFYSSALVKEELNPDPALALAEMLRFEEAPLEAIKVLDKITNVVENRGKGEWFGRSRLEVIQAKGLAAYQSGNVLGALTLMEKANGLENSPVTTSCILKFCYECAQFEAGSNKRDDYLERAFNAGYSLLNMIKIIDDQVVKSDSAGIIPPGTMLKSYSDAAQLTLRCGLEVAKNRLDNKNPKTVLVSQIAEIENMFRDVTGKSVPLTKQENGVIDTVTEGYNKAVWTWKIHLPQLCELAAP